VADFPTPIGYRQLTPAILGTPPVTEKMRRFERKRVVIGIAIAAVLHLALGLAWWLTPPLRLKAGYSPDRWVQILSLPKQEVVTAPPPTRLVPAVKPAPAKGPAQKALPGGSSKEPRPSSAAGSDESDTSVQIRQIPK
jgi:hypothetical protein